ncbi:hypothetical protein ACO0LM_13985 [Undibacterium sp. Di26W]|uniref:hypothetical protein n=1 Tax=Undibacterium sp. Di26W TaxID=3413035 RepID=UPI003BF142AF
MITYEIIPELARITTTIVLLTTLFNKPNIPLFEGTKQGSSLTFSLNIFEKIHLPFILCLSYLLLGSNWGAGPVAGSILLITMISTNYLLKWANLLRTCNCFGSMASGDQKITHVLNIFLLICSFITIAEYIHGKNMNSIPLMTNSYIAMILVSVLLAHGKNIFLWFKKSAKEIFPYSDKTQNKLSDMQGKKYFAKSLIIGENFKGEKIRIEDVTTDSPPLLIVVGLMDECDTCTESKPLFFRLAESYSNELQTIFVVKEKQVRETNLNGPLYLSGATEFFSEINAPGFPFCAVIRTKDLTLMGQVSMNPPAIWRTYFNALSLLMKAPIN